MRKKEKESDTGKYVDGNRQTDSEYATVCEKKAKETSKKHKTRMEKK